MSGGPQPMDQTSRMALAQEIANRALNLYGPQILAIGLYGSTARGLDGPYSDLEMMCILDSSGEDYTYEWSHGPWKAEVNFYSQDIVLTKAAEVEETWPLTHGAFQYILALYDPTHFFIKVRDTVTSIPQDCFTVTMHLLIVGQLYEWMGKLRNARQTGHTAYLPELALNMAKYGAFLIGLANRHCYSTGPRVLEESLTLPHRPTGYDTLCHLAMQGRLSDFQQIAACCEAFWSGVEQWATEQGICIEEPRRIPF